MSSQLEQHEQLSGDRKSNMSSRHADYDVIVVGAGPYGLSAGAHLKSKGLGVQVFGEPMEFWATKMPEGMLLRSPRPASNLSDPDAAFTLAAYEASCGKSPTAPVPLDTFVAYGKWFRQQLGSALNTTYVAQVERENGGFRATLQDGQIVRARRVVVAAGIGPFRKKPAVFEDLPDTYAGHCYERREIRNFSSKRVAVIGAGQSALESAALLHEAGADVEILSRRPFFNWVGIHYRLHHLGPISKIMYTYHDVGPAGISRLVAYPNLVAKVPLAIRDKIRTRAVRPAGSSWLIERLRNVKTSYSVNVISAKMRGEEVVLKLNDGSERTVDYVLMGTGYRVDISRYKFLSPKLAEEVEQFDGYPRLTRGFCSSVPGLHFIGATGARSFGPLSYFVTGSKFTCTELASYIGRNRVLAATE